MLINFIYREDGLFVSVYPNDTASEKFWNEKIAPKTNGNGKVVAVQFPAIKKQIEDAGYTVFRHHPPFITAPTANSSTT